MYPATRSTPEQHYHQTTTIMPLTTRYKIRIRLLTHFKISSVENLSLKMTLPWKRLIRFIATDGRTLRGEPILPSPETDLGFITEADQLQARVIEGSHIYDTTGATRVTDEIVTVKTMLGPLAQSDVPILRCVGLNYAKHSKISLHQPTIKNPSSI